MKWLIILSVFAFTAYGSSEILGEKSHALIKQGKLDEAKKLLESGRQSSIEPGIDFRLAQIAILKKRFDLPKSLDGFLKNTQVVENIYNSLPKSEQKKFIKKLPSDFFLPKADSACPFFEMSARKQRADLLFLFMDKVSSKVREQIIYELYVLLPEAVAEQKFNGEQSFKQVFARLSIQELVKRMELLMTFGQNTEAHKVFTDALARSTLQPEELCELRYADAKVERKMRKYKSSQENFVAIARSCPAMKLKARFMEIQLLSTKEDEESLPKFDAFVRDYPGHSFTDDVLFLKAQVLLSKNRREEAFKTLDQLIKDYPEGDMIEQAWFLKAMSHTKLGESLKAIESFKHLEKTAKKASMYHAGAIYWQARLAVFPEVLKLENPVFLSVENKKKLQALVVAPVPTVYSWLSLSLLTTLGITPDGPKKEQVASLPLNPKAPELLLIRDLIKHGFKDEALYLLDNIALDENQMELATWVARFYDDLNRVDLAHQKLVRCNINLALKLAEKLPNIYRKISYPTVFLGEVEQAHAHVDVPKALIYGIMRQESGFLPQSCSWAGAKGLMQLIYSSAKDQSPWWGIKDLQENDLYHPEINLVLASSLLKGYWQKFGNMVVGLSAYNAGPAAAKRWLAKNPGAPIDFYIEEITFKETKLYVKTVLGATFAYGRIFTVPHLALSSNQ